MAARSGETSRYVPSRGDVVWIDFDPTSGHEQAGVRPAVVLSHHAYNLPAGMAVVVPVTRSRKGYLFEVPIPAGFAVTGFVLTDQPRAIDWVARRARFIARLPESLLQEIKDRITSLLIEDE